MFYCKIMHATISNNYFIMCVSDTVCITSVFNTHQINWQESTTLSWRADLFSM